MQNTNQPFNVDDLLNNLLKPAPKIKQGLKELFEDRVRELKISSTTAMDIIKIQRRTLVGILEGTQKTVDYINFIKIANFLQIPRERVINLYMDEIEKNFPDEVSASPANVEFIKANFDLVELRKAGFIDNITDFEHIETRLVSFFGLKKITDYQQPPTDAAFSAGLIQPKNKLTRTTWIACAKEVLETISNPHEYDREALINYFPEIRWHSTNVEMGLINVIRVLYKMGITVIYQPPFSALHLRGATFSVNHKPCIVITNYKGFYATLWFALIHELFHVLFDWDEIQRNDYHVSDGDSEQLSVIAKEKEADDFAREYLFSVDKTAEARRHLNNQLWVQRYAENNHVHPSFIYTFYAKDHGDRYRMAWAAARKHNPPFDKLLKPIENPWNSAKPITEYVKSIKYIYS